MRFPDLPQPVIEGLESLGIVVALGLLLLTASARIAAIGKKDHGGGTGHFLLERQPDRLEEARLVTRPPRQTGAGPRTQVSRRSGRSSRKILSKLSCTQKLS